MQGLQKNVLPFQFWSDYTWLKERAKHSGLLHAQKIKSTDRISAPQANKNIKYIAV